GLLDLESGQSKLALLFAGDGARERADHPRNDQPGNVGGAEQSLAVARITRRQACIRRRQARLLSTLEATMSFVPWSRGSNHAARRAVSVHAARYDFGARRTDRTSAGREASQHGPRRRRGRIAERSRAVAGDPALLLRSSALLQARADQLFRPGR